ncbi:putative UPF0481 protein At3g02645 [Phoenix dactylifera]|uniref:UPF0481 protein At3g02645 n=1 Tax=Phoenix dactylifera TaxID=42345 RepID=A0A8B7CV95_PHODC|nr:putative UPF0481 protein At3g02645 [Phoenix dactylifera]
MPSDQNHSLDEFQWVIRIRRVLEEEFEDDDDDDHPITITTVPKPLLCSKPEAYTPQYIAIGPYHHRREELHDMERYKLSAAKRTQNQLSNLKFQNLVDLIAKLEHRIRANYYRYLNYNGETLAWMMAIDASFLLEFLQIYSVNEGNTLQRFSSATPRLIDSIRRTSTRNMLLRDIIMLENQIPLFLLEAILEVQCSSSKIAHELLHSMLVGFLKDLSPLKMIESSSCISIIEYSHLLEFVYYNLVPKIEEQIETSEETDHDEKSHESASCIKWLAGATRDFISSRARAFVFAIIMFLVKLPWRIVSSLPILSILMQPVEHLLSFEMNQNSEPNNECPNHGNTTPLLEEIVIPSVTELRNAGIKFSPTNGNLSTIDFNTRTATFRLPVITLDDNSEVVLRNLVAYEASVGSRSLALSRYVELMNGIIDTIEDAKLLREGGIVLNRLKSDQEVAELWNGMTRSIRLTRVRTLDKVIEDVNNYYCSRWRVKIRRFLKRYIVDSWECLVFLAIISFFLVMCLQAFCVTYGCAPWFHGK